jgi:radical SAM protein with 4Fe4S-binding SPASM domain
MKRQIVLANTAASCYFRTSVEYPFRKVLIQITERCNLHCAHCFINAGKSGREISLSEINNIIPKLRECRVVSITLTGGEPFCHAKVIEIASCLVDAGFTVSICTNATCIKEDDAKLMASIGNIHLNVSLDGFAAKSHGKFRGNMQSFPRTISTIKMLGECKILQGILVTPNNLAQIDEYSQICLFAAECGASYVLMNPLSPMGRGVDSMGNLAMGNETMRSIKSRVLQFADKIQLALVHFPNDDKFPLSVCEAGNIIYIFANGKVAVCPYLVFAARTKQSVHDPEEFIVGNIFFDNDIAAKLDAYNLQSHYQLGLNLICEGCHFNLQCGKGCPAAVVASGNRIEAVDVAMCPKLGT